MNRKPTRRRHNPDNGHSPFVPYADGIKAAQDFAAEVSSPVTICGGLAMAAYGSDRMTKDVDLLVRDLPRSLRPDHPLSFGGYAYTINGVTVDAIRRNDDFQFIYDAAREDPKFMKGLGGLGVVRPEWLALMKQLAGRTKDMHDLSFLIRSGLITMPKMRRVLVQCFGDRGSLTAINDFEQLFLLEKIRMAHDIGLGEA